MTKKLTDTLLLGRGGDTARPASIGLDPKLEFKVA